MAEDRSDAAVEIDTLYARGAFADAIAVADRAPNAIRRDAQAQLLVGLSHAMTGAGVKAAATLERARALKPGDPAILGALARVRLMLGDAAAAEPLIAELARAARVDPAGAHHLAEAYLQAGRAEDAFAALSAAVNAFNHPLLDIRLAEAAIRTRRIEVGVAAARRAETRLGRTPAVINVAGPAALLARDEPWLASLTAATQRIPAAHAAAIFDFWTIILMAGDHLRAAHAAAEMAAARAPSAERLRLLSDLRLAARDIAGGEEAARAAVALQPKDAAAMTLLARCRIFAGAVEDAKRILLEAVAADPDSGVAFDYLTQLDARAMSAEMAAHLERRMAERALPPDAIPKTLLALARRDEALGEHARAFGRIIEAKAIIARIAKAAGGGYRPEETEEYLARVRTLFPEPLSPIAAASTPRPIFIVGMPRSGTSLVEQILSSHPDVYGGGELPEMISIMNEFVAAAKTRDDATRLIAANGAASADRFLKALPAEARRAAAVTDKHPLNFWSIGLIRAIFPDARIINLVRPPVDVCLSILRVRFFNEYAFANEIDAVAHYYSAYERMTAHWRGLFPGGVYDADYEKLVVDPEGETRALLSYCALPWSASCLAFHQTKRNVITHSAAQVREPINTRAIERRRDYGDALKPLEKALERRGVRTSPAAADRH